MILKGKIALVTGATRGAGRGIAIELGEAGSIVYITGRSVRGEATADDLPGTIEDTAEAVTAHGGTAIPVRCDHTSEDQIKTLFEQVRKEHGRIDLLVNNAWGGYEGYRDDNFGVPFWEQPFGRWNRMVNAGLWSHMATSYHAVPLMLPQQQGLIINTTLPTEDVKDFRIDNPRRFPTFYITVKAAINQMTFGMAHNLRPKGISVIGLAPGWMRTERILRIYKTDEQHWHENPELEPTESTRYVGRAVIALASDPKVIGQTGRVMESREAGLEYGFTDIDGRRPAIVKDLEGDAS